MSMERTSLKPAQFVSVSAPSAARPGSADTGGKASCEWECVRGWAQRSQLSWDQFMHFYSTYKRALIK